MWIKFDKYMYTYLHLDNIALYLERFEFDIAFISRTNFHFNV